MIPISAPILSAAPGLGLLIRLKARLLRNRVRQLVDQSPLTVALAMILVLAFSTAVLVYGALFGRAEPSFLLAMPHIPRNIVTIMYLEAIFFASWSLLLLGLPLMLAIGHVQGLPWHFYAVFVVAFL